MEIFEKNLILIDIFSLQIKIPILRTEESINLANPFRIIFAHKNNQINLTKQETFPKYNEQIIKLKSPDC